MSLSYFVGSKYCISQETRSENVYRIVTEITFKGNLCSCAKMQIN